MRYVQTQEEKEKIKEEVKYQVKDFEKQYKNPITFHMDDKTRNQFRQSTVKMQMLNKKIKIENP